MAITIESVLSDDALAIGKAIGEALVAGTGSFTLDPITGSKVVAGKTLSATINISGSVGVTG